MGTTGGVGAVGVAMGGSVGTSVIEGGAVALAGLPAVAQAVEPTRNIVARARLAHRRRQDSGVVPTRFAIVSGYEA
jgi:hypothetical protein